MSIRLLDGLSDIASQYDALICDVWGVLHDGHRVNPPAAEALRRFRQERGPVVLLTNAPRVPDEVLGQFAAIGVPTDCYDSIVSSGGAARGELALRSSQKPLSLYYIGPDRDLSITQGLDIRLAPLEEAELVLLIGMRDDEQDTPADYAEELARVRARGLTILCANPDLVVHRGPRLLWCAGSLARDYEALGGDVIYYGKPHAPVYAAARAATGGAKNPLAIGDGMFTDVKGANAQGLDLLFIADGIHGEEIEPYTSAHLTELLAANGVHAQAALRALTW